MTTADVCVVRTLHASRYCGRIRLKINSRYLYAYYDIIILKIYSIIIYEAATSENNNYSTIVPQHSRVNI